MSSQIIRILLFSLIFIFLCITLSDAKVQSARLAVALDAGKWKAVRLKNLPKNSVITVEINSDDVITVALVDEADYPKYPDSEDILFESEVRNKLSFSVTIPVAGHYYLVLDNIWGKRLTKTKVYIRGASGDDSVLKQNSTSKDPGKVDQEVVLSKIIAKLKKLFIFKSFSIKSRSCGKEEAYSSSDGIMLCTEFIKKIYDSSGSKEKSIDIMLFTIFHEVGHILLLQWNYPFYDNEDITDEFATMMMLMLGKKDNLNAVTEFFISNPSSSELISKALQGDRHQLSIQRARNIISWQKDAERFKRWQTIFVPHMQTAVLEKLRKSNQSWADQAFIEKELSLRKKQE